MNGGRKPDNRTVYLNGISVELLEQRADGAIALRVRAGDTRLAADVRWCADSIVLPRLNGFQGTALTLAQGRTLRLDRSGTPTRLAGQGARRGGGHWFSPPTRFTVADGARVVLERKARLQLLNGSVMHLMPGAELRLAKKAKLDVQAGARIVLHGPATVQAKPRVLDVARAHRRVFLTLGLGILLVSAVRASRQVVIPLWADHLGINPTTTSIIYGLVAAIDMSVFYPAGTLMDRRGRLWVAVPSTLLMGFALIGTSLTSGVIGFLIVSMMLGMGNGIGSGIVMTLGADAAPSTGRTEFLGIWRLVSDLGSSLGPVVLSAITALVSLAAAVAAMGTFGLAGAAVFWRWLPRGNAPAGGKGA